MRQGQDAMQVKVEFPFEGGVETLWADELGGGLYRVPIFAYGINLHDVFTANSSDDGRLLFKELVSRSGNETIRLTLPEQRSSDMRKEIAGTLAHLDRIANGREQYGSDYYVYSLPPDANSEMLEPLLERGENRGLWSWELSLS